MPPIDFRKVPDSKEFPLIPPGKYLALLDDVEVKDTQHGDEMWNLQWVITEGRFSGQRLFDRLVFSEKAMPRVKLVCKRLGVDTSGMVDLQPGMLKGKRAYVHTTHETYDGTTRNKIPFEGYEPISTPIGDTHEEDKYLEQAPAEVKSGKVPF